MKIKAKHLSKGKSRLTKYGSRVLKVQSYKLEKH